MPQQISNRLPALQVKLNKAGKRLPRLVSLPLLIIITVALTTIHSESSLHPASSSTLRPISTQKSDSLLPAKNPISLDQAKAAVAALTALDTAAEQLLVPNHNNAISHAVLIGGSNLQQQQPQPQAEFPNKTNSDQPNQFLHVHLSDSSGGQGAEPTNQIFETNEGGRGVIPETNFENVDQQLKINDSLVEGGQIVQQVDGGPLEVVVKTEMPKESHKSASGQQLKYQGLEKRFGLLKKGRNYNNNYNDNLVPFSNLGTVPYFNNDCDRCLSYANSDPQGAAWLPEPLSFRQQPLIQPPVNHNAPPLTNHFGPFKKKLNKFQFTKPMLLGDPYYGQNYPMSQHRYRLPITSGRMQSHRTRISQQRPYSCIQPMINSATISTSVLSNQDPIEDSIVAQQKSYSNSQY